MASTRPICFFHKNCLDGRGAAAVVSRKEPDCEFLALQYGMARPRVLGRKVYIVDFCLPLEEMRAVRAEASEVIWIDHHGSQKSVHAQLGWGVLDTNECGTSLTWKTLFPDVTPPPIVDYIKDKDLWRWLLPDSRAIAAGLELTYKGDRFDGILDVDLSEMAKLGKPALEELAKRIAAIIPGGKAVENAYGLKGVRAFAVNCNKDLNDVGEQICLPVSTGGLGYDLAVLYYRKHTNAWVHSLRSSGVIDCSLIAVARGGGGHPTASCYLAKEPFVESRDCPGESGSPEVRKSGSPKDK
jgi:uncharacterized protein